MYIKYNEILEGTFLSNKSGSEICQKLEQLSKGCKSTKLNVSNKTLTAKSFKLIAAESFYWFNMCFLKQQIK